MTSEVTSDLKFEISNINYPGNNVHVVLNTLFSGLRGHEGLQMTSEVTSDLKFELSGLNNPSSSAFLAPKCFSELNVPGGRKKGQISSIDLLASPQVKSQASYYHKLKQSINYLCASGH